MRTHRTSVFVSVALVAALLTGCAPEAPESTDSASPTPSSSTPSSPSATPSSTPSAAAEPDPEDPSTWVISDAGIGPIEIGGDFATTLAGLPGSWRNDPETCGWVAGWTAPDPSWGMFFSRGAENATDPILHVSVDATAGAPTDAPLTAQGIGAGATRDAILAAYPDAEEGTAQVGGGTWVKLAGEGAAHVFFNFREGESVASDVVVTSRDEPSYELCG